MALHSNHICALWLPPLTSEWFSIGFGQLCRRDCHRKPSLPRSRHDLHGIHRISQGRAEWRQMQGQQWCVPGAELRRR